MKKRIGIIIAIIVAIVVPLWLVLVPEIKISYKDIILTWSNIGEILKWYSGIASVTLISLLIFNGISDKDKEKIRPFILNLYQKTKEYLVNFYQKNRKYKRIITTIIVSVLIVLLQEIKTSYKDIVLSWSNLGRILDKFVQIMSTALIPILIYYFGKKDSDRKELAKEKVQQEKRSETVEDYNTLLKDLKKE